MSPVRNMSPRPGSYGPVGSAVDVTKAARDLLKRCGSWPFPWCFAPPGSQPLVAMGTIALPAVNTQTNITSFNVPVGKIGYVDSLLLQMNDANYKEGLGFAKWAVLVNQPAAQTFAIGRPSQGYGLITTQMGLTSGIGSQNGMVAQKLPFGILLGSNDTLYIHITIPNPPASGGANPLGVGYPSSTTAWALGWIWPASEGEMGF